MVRHYAVLYGFHTFPNMLKKPCGFVTNKPWNLLDEDTVSTDKPRGFKEKLSCVCEDKSAKLTK